MSHLDGLVTVTVPKGVRESEALAFAAEKKGWIRHHLARRPEEVVVGPGCSLPVEGRDLRVIAVSGRSVRIEDGALLVPERESSARIAGFLKALARERLVAACDIYADRLGRRFTGITLRDTRSRWGSCSARGGLNFSWRLIMAPPDVLGYVAAHEVAHLAEMNHSPAFWSQVERIHGPYDAPRNWLRQRGGDLHRYRF